MALTGTNQKTKIVQYLRVKGRISPLVAISEIGCHRLAARVLELKQRGFGISTHRATAMNGSTYAEYHLDTLPAGFAQSHPLDGCKLSGTLAAPPHGGYPNLLAY
jgi:hypothetical protein